MKSKIILIAAIYMGILFGSCQKSFLQMPITNTTNLDSVFSTTSNAMSAISQAYSSSLTQGITYQGAWAIWNAMIQANLSGELTYGFDWTISQSMILNGYTANGSGEDMDGYDYNFTAIRQDYLVKENIDKVKDMSDADKQVVKAEMQALIAYRYEQMFIIYGGVPIVSKSFEPSDDLAVPRAPLSAVLDSIVSWCDQSASVLPSKWPSTYQGRMTKSAALAIKAKALIYAARPLFNTGTPYLGFGSNADLICLGSADPTRWQTALDASEAVIKEAEGSGALHIINTGNPLADYGTATSTPGNAEVILAYKNDNGSSDANGNGPMACFYDFHDWQSYGNGLTYNFLTNYYKQDGTDQSWPGLTAKTNFSDYLTKMGQMEARFQADFKPWQMDCANNPGDNFWSNASTWQWGTTDCALVTKFYYKAGTRSWFEFPIFRLAAYYLTSAEAYNELGQTQNALARLNVVHERAGLPAVTETNQTKLRAIIQREWAVEFFDENYRLHDVKHWMLSNIGNGIIGGNIYGFAYNDGSISLQYDNTNYQQTLKYVGYWSPRQYLNPFPQSEVNKGIIVQNPGY